MLAAGTFVVTAEIAPPASARPDEVRRLARFLRDYADACNVTDCPRARVRMSSWAGAAILLQEEVEPIMQVVVRDRNRIALQADILGAAAIGVRNVLCMSGDDVGAGNEPGARSVRDVTSEEQIAMYRALRDEGRLLGGDRVDDPPPLFLGAVANPFEASPEHSFASLRGKVEAGADFVQTQAVYDPDAFEEWMHLVRKEWLHERAPILAGIIPLKSAKAARFLAENVPGVAIPEEIRRRMEGSADPKEEGVRIATEAIERLRGMEGVAGIHVMAVNWEDVVPRIVERAGLTPRPRVG